ncbi:beta-glucosidase/6-phospho-beta-glucosidase/beta-galactosidase [Paenibacillus sp. PastF-1]|nr:beta-glucosidase/6-phospho-beta-glucosidase/beta-galactosidase [Paenibacillus sp. PastF-2]MDF9850746.1 beta-glucosidase/6-phospho-beta-glucosidase/beta-galactosidase [Paenibacillus sp. PastM-2]MDF9857316.1 beta-glucosidase/6-phospho-beta-glucosidase/beta-galactosidase [Paenibacillus sp. PastF-1]MDH6482576.1 beta-glucosidase/6-phospho-beta-glucosidase/beta-galactosidase [Paenibacillus sp. PastH-2]MDH6510003.1 beta-glucosidase/6-phospho-beta-glucosidase/beta-galactosidase [Paenibacillus sp. Pa
MPYAGRRNGRNRGKLQENFVDFLSFSYYLSSAVSTDNSITATTAGNLSTGLANPYLQTSDWAGRCIRAACGGLKEMHGRYQIPLFMVENGLGAADELAEDGSIQDDYRIDYLAQHNARWLRRSRKVWS